MYSNSNLESVDFDKEYLPSLNTKRFQAFPNPHEQSLENFIKVTGEETQRVRSKYNVREERYGFDADNGEDNQLLDIYYKTKENDTPIFVFIHGGYWQICDKSTAGSFVAPLVERGHRVVVLDYNRCPNVSLLQLTTQVCQFFKWLFKYADETNASDISLCAHSAGAHLLSYLLSDKRLSAVLHEEISYLNRIRSLFFISGVYDLTELWKLESVNPNDILKLNERDAKKLSPLCWDLKTETSIGEQKKIMCKIHVLVAGVESNTFIGQSEEFAKKLAAAGFETKFKILKNYDHFDIIEEAAVEGSEINRYIVENLEIN